MHILLCFVTDAQKDLPSFRGCLVFFGRGHDLCVSLKKDLFMCIKKFISTTAQFPFSARISNPLATVDPSVKGTM